MCDLCIQQNAIKLEAEIAEYLKKHPVEHMPPKVRSDVLIETPKIIYRPLESRVDPGWTRRCEHCKTATQGPDEGHFLTYYHNCEIIGRTIEWPPSIGRNYA